MTEATLKTLLSRLESVASRLESVEKQLAAGGGAAGGGSSSSGGAGASASGAKAVEEFDGLIRTYIDEYVSISAKIDPLVKQQADLVKGAVQAQRALLDIASKSKKPTPDVFNNLLKPTADLLEKIIALRDSNRPSPFFNHLSAISEGIPALGWVTVSPTPGPHVDEARSSSEFYSNKILVQYRHDTSETGKTNVAWVTAWNTFLKELRQYIKTYHTTELSWNAQGGAASASASSAAPAPSAGGAPPPPGPPPPIDFSAPASTGGGADTRSALLADINKVKERQAGGKTEGLRHVTKDMKTKNQPKTDAPVPAASSASKPSSSGGRAAKAPSAPPKLALEGSKWVIEHQHGNKQLVIDNPEVKHTVYVYKCENSVLQINGKVNAITIDSCKKVGLVFGNAISVVEVVNCASIQVQVTGKVPAVQVDKTSGCQIFLSEEALDVEIVTSKSDELNVCLPGKNPGDDITEIAIPEQFKTVINRNTRSLTTEAVAHV